MGTTEDYLEKLYQTLYEAEMETSYKLDAQINLPTAVVTGLLAVSAFYIEHFPKIEPKPGVILFIMVLAIYGGFLLGAIYCMIRSYFNNKYKFLPAPDEIDQNATELRDHYEGTFEEENHVDHHVKADIQCDIINVYKQSASFNRRTNINRIAWLHWSTTWIICSIVALGVSRGVYYVGAAATRPQEMTITEMPKIQLMDSPQRPKFEVSGLPDVQKVEIIAPKKDGK
jgi:hypothetical protein